MRRDYIMEDCILFEEIEKSAIRATDGKFLEWEQEEREQFIRDVAERVKANMSKRSDTR